MNYEDLPANDKMASLRTSLSIQRTRMAAERTLMATMRVRWMERLVRSEAILSLAGRSS